MGEKVDFIYEVRCPYCLKNFPHLRTSEFRIHLDICRKERLENDEEFEEQVRFVIDGLEDVGADVEEVKEVIEVLLDEDVEQQKRNIINRLDKIGASEEEIKEEIKILLGEDVGYEVGEDYDEVEINDSNLNDYHKQDLESLKLILNEFDESKVDTAFEPIKNKKELINKNG